MCWATTNRLSFLDDIPCTDKFYTKNVSPFLLQVLFLYIDLLVYLKLAVSQESHS